MQIIILLTPYKPTLTAVPGDKKVFLYWRIVFLKNLAILSWVNEQGNLSR